MNIPRVLTSKVPMLDNDDIKMNKGGLCSSQWNLYPVEEANKSLPTQGHLDTQGHQEQLCKIPRRKFLSNLSAKKISFLLTFLTVLFLSFHMHSISKYCWAHI